MRIKLKYILKAVSEIYKIPLAELKSHDRHAILVRPRKIFYRAGTEAGHTPSTVARYLDRDHTTILHGVKTAKCTPEDILAIIETAKERQEFELNYFRS